MRGRLVQRQDGSASPEYVAAVVVVVGLVAAVIALAVPGRTEEVGLAAVDCLYTTDCSNVAGETSGSTGSGSTSVGGVGSGEVGSSVGGAGSGAGSAGGAGSSGGASTARIGHLNQPASVRKIIACAEPGRT